MILRRRFFILVILTVACFLQPLSPGGVVAFEPAGHGERDPYLSRLLLNSPVKPAGEIRALWVVRDALTTPESIDRCVDLAAAARFQLLFVQVRGRGDAYYYSSVEPPAQDLGYPIESFDPLEYLLVRARAAGISVHAWVNVFYVWSDGSTAPPPGHVTLLHPDWIITNDVGDHQKRQYWETTMDEMNAAYWQEQGVEGYFMDPFIPEVREYTARVVGDLLSRYNLDGIHLDYIRFPGAQFGYSRETRTKFALAWGVDPVELKTDTTELVKLLGAGAVSCLDSILVDWRAQQVDSMVAAIREVAGDITVSAAVVPEPDRAFTEKGQDWVKWVHERLVDFVVPMAYNQRPDELLPWLQVVENAIGRDRMLVGLAIHDGRDAYLERMVNLLRLDGAAGFSIFSYNVLAEQRFPLRFLQEAIFSGVDLEE